jgi:hypothetical protein
MAAEQIPEDVRRFILTSVISVPFVEALLVFRDAAGAPVTIELLAQRLYIGERQAADILEQLRAARIVEALPEGAGHRYAPAPDLAEMIEKLVSFYRSHLLEVTKLIHSRTSRMAHQFADAFRLRKE